MKYLLTQLLLVSLAITIHAALKIQEIRTASDNVLEVFLLSNIVNVEETDLTLSKWKINDISPQSIYHYAMESDSCNHFVYLESTQFQEGTSYKISTPYGDTTITFNYRDIFCSSIKTNQAAYSALSKSNFALFAIWLGNGGKKKITGPLPEYEVFEQYTNQVVASGTLVEVGENSPSGDFVYRIDLSNVPEGGPYKIGIKGFGSSYPFGVGGDFSKRLAYIMFRSQYYQRCGCPIIEPYGMQIRENPCHTIIYDTDGPIGEANIVVSGNERTFKCYGGYHDAGDADRRAYHISNPIINLMIFEAFPDIFYDGQFNIPDLFDSSFNIIGKGNGIPDIIDEAIWGTLIWEYLQNEDGSIHFGTETKGYPDPFNAPMDKDNKKYGTVVIDDRAASVGAGLFMHLGRILQSYDTAHSKTLVERAERSFKYIENKMANPEKLYYYVQKYLYDGDPEAHAKVKELKDVVENYDKNIFGCYGYSLNNSSFDNPGYFLSYLVEKNRSIDSSVVNSFRNALKNAADANLAELSKYAYPIGNDPIGTAWGHNVMQPIYACAPLLQWRFEKEQKYMDGACDLMNYIFGLNPLGISYVTEVGMYQIKNPHDRECAYTKGKGMGLKPGITIFGPGVIQSRNAPSTFPELSTLPVERKFGDDINSISTAEFTIFETMSHNALFAVLSNGGTWDEKNDPFAKQQPNSIHNIRNSNDFKKNPFAVILNKNKLHLKFNLKSATHVRGAIYQLNGAEVMKFDFGKLSAGTHQIILPVNSVESSRLTTGISIFRLSANSQLINTCIVNRYY